MSPSDRQEFREYLKGLTDRQVWGCLEKEKNRRNYRELVEDELERRGLK